MREELPKDWKWEQLKDVCRIYQGYGFPKDLQGFKNGQYPFYKVGDISKNVKSGFRILNFCDNYIDEKVLAKLKAKLYPKNTIVFAKIGEALKLNRRAIINIPGIVDNNAIGIKANENNCIDLYLFHFFSTVKLEDYSRATTVPSVRKSDIEEINIPLPPKPTQLAIVSKIEELFSELEKGIESLFTAKQQLKTYRQSVLKWAFEGKLTEMFAEEKVRLNFHKELEKLLKSRNDKFSFVLESAKKNKLPKPRTPKNLDKKFKTNQSYLRFINFIPKEWSIIHLASISNDLPDSVVDGPFGSSINVEQDYVACGVPVIRINNILQFEFEKNKLKFIRQEKFNELKRHNVLPGDVLFGKVGTIGNSCIYPNGEPEAMLSTTGSCRIRVDDKIILNKFLCYYLNSQKNNFNEIASAAVQAFLNMETINNFPIPICSIEEQHCIVQAIESRLSVADKMEESITQSLQQAEALKQSILKKAFEGKLI